MIESDALTTVKTGEQGPISTGTALRGYTAIYMLLEKNINFPGECQENAQMMLKAFASLKYSTKCWHDVQKSKTR